MKKLLGFAFLSMCLFLVSCESSNSKVEDNNVKDIKILRIATTTSLFNTGLLEALEKDFEGNFPYEIEYIVSGSGAAIEAGAKGEADGIFVHSKKAEEVLVADGTSLGRNTIMYNFFEIVGPEPLIATDFDGVLKEIREEKTFVSRGDNSGTHVKELSMWDDKLPTDYIETGKGMLDTLLVANELGGYVLTDDATFITHQEKLDLVEIYKDDNFFKNEYSFHCMNPEINQYVNNEAAEVFLDYLLTDETLNFIAEFGVEKFGKPLYALSK